MEHPLSVDEAGGVALGRDAQRHGRALARRDRIRWVQIDVDAESSDHLVHPEDRLRVILAKQ